MPFLSSNSQSATGSLRVNRGTTSARKQRIYMTEADCSGLVTQSIFEDVTSGLPSGEHAHPRQCFQGVHRSVLSRHNTEGVVYFTSEGWYMFVKEDGEWKMHMI